MSIAKLDLDATDKTLLRLLQDDGRLSNSRLAEAVSLSEAPCWRRVKRLEEAGYITRYQAMLDQKRLGYGVTAFVQVKFASHRVELAREFEQAIQTLPQIMACYNVTGSADYLLHVVAEDLEAYGDLTLNTIRKLPGVDAIHSSLCLREIKTSTRIPV